jgi:lysyl-tRNA synthetase, class II
MRSFIRISSATAVGLAVTLAAPGWLYLAASWDRGRPAIGDALPLDELPSHAGAPLAVFLLVWAAAAAMLGLLARATRADRLHAALLLAVGVGVWLYLETAVSILAVRQITAEDALRVAAAIRAVYVPAALAGLAGATLTGARRPPRPRAPVILAALVAATGLLGVLDALVPEHGQTLLATLAPAERPLARSLEGPLGLALLAGAPGLARRRARAWQVVCILLVLSSVVHLLHSDYGAVPVALLALALISRRQDFDAPGDPAARAQVVSRAAVLAAAVLAYGLAAIWAHDLAAERPFRVTHALVCVARASVGLGLTGVAPWYSLSMLVLVAAGVAWVVHAWLAPWRYRHAQETRTRETCRTLIRAFGVDTLAPFALRSDKSYFFDDDETAFLAYRVVAGVAIVSGDPIGPVDAFAPLLDAFIAHAHRRDWRIAVLGASERALPLYRARGFRALYHGDEAMLDVATFSLEGRAIRKVRQSVHRLRRAGYAVQVLRAGDVATDLRRELEQIARAWRGAAPERGFAMALDALFRLDDDDAVFAVGIDPEGHAAGFLHFAVCAPAHALSLSSMPRLRDTPNGFNEWLVCEVVEWARANDVERISLNFAPFAALLAADAVLTPLQRVERRLLLALKGRFQLDNLLVFNRKFLPTWQRRFVVYERRLDLPRVGIAALAAEAYLPFSRRPAP